MQLRFVPLIVRNQDEALHFYIGRLGFHAQADLMMGPGKRFLTVSAPDGIEGVQLILSLAGVQEEVAAQRARYIAGIPAIAINTGDAAGEHARLSAAGVEFTQRPKDLGVIVSAIFDDTCGNLIHLVQARPM